MAAVALSRFEQAEPVLRRKIRAFANRHYQHLPGVDPAEIQQEILEVLWLCCVTYDPDKGAKFTTFFWTCAERRYTDLHRSASRKMRVGDYDRVSLDEWLDQDVVREQITRVIQSPSAEDEALANMRVIEVFRSKTR